MLLTPDLPDAAPHSSAKAALTVIGAILPITGSSPLFLFRLSQTSGLEGILLLVSKDFHKLVVLGSLNWTQHKRPEQLALDRVVTACKLACMHKTFSVHLCSCTVLRTWIPSSDQKSTCMASLQNLNFPFNSGETCLSYGSTVLIGFVKLQVLFQFHKAIAVLLMLKVVVGPLLKRQNRNFWWHCAGCSSSSEGFTWHAL